MWFRYMRMGTYQVAHACQWQLVWRLNHEQRVAICHVIDAPLLQK